jgi:hypothetical protein
MQRITHTITWKYMPLYEKIAHLNSCIHNSKHVNESYINKLLSRDVAKHLCNDIELPKIHKIFVSACDFTADDICNNRILKLTHGSGNILILHDSMNFTEIMAKLQEWKLQFSRAQIYIEESITDYYTKEAGNAYTIQVKCIHGSPFAIDVKYKNMYKSYDLEWRELPLFINMKLSYPVEKPPVLDTILQYAKQLSQSFEFIRVDFFVDTDLKIYFNEFDFSPNGGYIFYTPEQEKVFGKLWK